MTDPNGSAFLMGNNASGVESKNAAVSQRTQNLYSLNEQSETVQKISNAFERSITITNALPDGRNGSFDPKTGTISVSSNIDSDSEFRYVAGHELTHSTQLSKSYAQLENYVMNTAAVESIMKTVGNQESLIQSYIADAAENGITLSEQQAKNEFVSDYCAEVLFKDENAFKQLARANGNLFEKIGQWIKNTALKAFGTDEQKQAAELRTRWQNAYKAAQAETAAEPYLKLNGYDTEVKYS